ncbi:MAG: protein-disulfide reductase DsbD family protein [Roseovarius sp.]|jgi:DsbC/DsbD-like thiol-disulfide interchange protein|nr:protein-disulfide reductase DsbD family protein [Roseovarius sp.]
MMRKSLRLFAAAFCAALSLGPAQAQQGSDLVEMRVLPGWRTASGVHMAGLEVRMRPGWKTYWRAPGDSGIPPQFDWRRSGNLSGVEIVWPTPSVTVEDGLRTIGYKDSVILPIRVAPGQAGRDVALNGRVEMGVCKDVCVPVELQVSGLLPGNSRQPDPRIAAALASRPYTAKEAKVARVACRISPIEDGIGLRAEIDMPRTGGGETAIVEVDDPRIWVAPARTVRQGGRLVAETKLYHVEGRSFALNRSGIRITVVGQSRAVDIQGCPAG